jgi:alkanesulfonate monooxygenase SsuD/methylene tetrahydromethanopterin reductase-like flavin-dependent oxidoreductase (luciferase family)
MRYSTFSVNDHYPARGRSVAALYDQVIAQCELAEALGYDTFFCAEHHFHEYGVVPNPAVMQAALSQRTKRIRLGTGISILTFHDPRTVAETYAMLDVLSGGRVVYGVGSGYLKHEFAGYNVDLAEKRDRFDECLAVVKRLLTGERVTHKGKYFNVDAVQLNVLPIQQPYPPIYVAVLAAAAAYHVGKQGNNIKCVPYASAKDFDDVGNLLAEYRRGRVEGGHGVPEDREDAIFTFHTHVAESDEEARRGAEAAFNLYVDTRLYAHKHTYDDVQASGLGLFGSVDTVADKVARLHEMGLNHVSTLQNFGMIDPARVRRSMELFAKEVMPRVEKRIGKKNAA